MSGLLMHFISGVSSYYFGWITSSLLVYLSLLTFFSVKILILDKNRSHLRQDLFGLAGSFIFCFLIALIQGVLLGTGLYFISNVTEIGIIKKVLYNAFVPTLIIGYDYVGKKMTEKESLKSKEN